MWNFEDVVKKLWRGRETDDVGGDIDTMYTATTDEEYGSILSENDGDGELVHQYDGVWSTEALVDPDGEASGPYRYQAFGLAASSAGDAWSTLTTGQWSQMSVSDWATLPVNPMQSHLGAWGEKQYYVDPETALFILGSGTNGRYYDPIIGRFISEDPIRQESGEPNLSRFVGNNPINKIDPSGHTFADWLEAGASVVGLGDQAHAVRLSYRHEVQEARNNPNSVLSQAVLTVDQGRVIANKVVELADKGIEWATDKTLKAGEFIYYNIEKTAAEALLAGLKTLTGVDGQTLIQFVKDIGGDIYKFGANLINNGDKILGALVDGVKQGFNLFCDDDVFGKKSCKNLPNRLLEAVEKWLGLNLTGLVAALQEAIGGKFDLIIQYILQIIGYDWDGILGVIAEEAGSAATAVIGFVVGEIEEVADKGVGAWLKEKIDQAKGLIGDLPKILWDLAWGGLQSLFIRLGGEALAGVVAKLIPGAGWVKTLWDGVKYLWDNRTNILGLVNGIKDGLVAILGPAENLVGIVADKVNMGIQTGLQLLLEGLASLLSLGSIPDKLHDALDEVKDKAQTPLKKLAGLVLTPARDFINKLVAGITGTKILAANRVEGAEVWLEQKEGQERDVVVRYNPTLKLPRELFPLRDQMSALVDEMDALTDQLKTSGDAKGKKNLKKMFAEKSKKLKALSKEVLDNVKRIERAKPANAVKRYKVMTYQESYAAGDANAGDWLTGDHIPSYAAIEKFVENKVGTLKRGQPKLLKDNTNVVVIDYDLHVAGRTYGGKNTSGQIERDGKSIATLQKAAKDDEDLHLVNARRLDYEVDKLDDAFKILNRRNASLFDEISTKEGIRNFFNRVGGV